MITNMIEHFVIASFMQSIINISSPPGEGFEYLIILNPGSVFLDRISADIIFVYNEGNDAVIDHQYSTPSGYVLMMMCG